MAAQPGRASTQPRLAPIRTNHAFEDKSIMPTNEQSEAVREKAFREGPLLRLAQ
jgi:hypothetical protein